MIRKSDLRSSSRTKRWLSCFLSFFLQDMFLLNERSFKALDLKTVLSQHALLRTCEARLTGVLPKGGKMHGVATNVYLWKTLEKTKETVRNENSNVGSCIYV